MYYKYLDWHGAVQSALRIIHNNKKESMPANLRQALKNLEEKGGSLDDLPTKCEATDWNVIAAESSLGPLELVVLKTHREQQQHQDGE